MPRPRHALKAQTIPSSTRLACTRRILDYASMTSLEMGLPLWALLRRRYGVIRMARPPTATLFVHLPKLREGNPLSGGIRGGCQSPENL